MMLVLSRKKNESIVIYDPANMEFMARVTVVEIRGDKVRLGITAPRDIHAHRQEVYDAIHGGSTVSRPGEALPAVTATTLQGATS